jgi:DNA-binding FadR family transcriptional regulator
MMQSTSPSDPAEATITALERLLAEKASDAARRLPPERELAQTLGVSRRQLRVALDALEARGIVFRRHGQGTFAGPPPLPDAGRHRTLAAIVPPDQIMDVRLQIEPHLARLAAQRITPDEAAQLQALMLNSCNAENAEAYDLADEIFHYRIAVLAGNALFMEIYQLIRQLRREKGWRDRRAVTNVPHVLRELAQQHRAIYEAIAAANPEAAGVAVRAHMDYVAHAIAAKT